MPIWILETSKDKGKTWTVQQPYHIYKKEDSANKKLSKMPKGWRNIYRVTEYVPLEGSECHNIPNHAKSARFGV